MEGALMNALLKFMNCRTAKPYLSKSMPVLNAVPVLRVVRKGRLSTVPANKAGGTNRGCLSITIKCGWI